MSVEPVGKPQCFLQVDFPRSFEPGSAAERFWGNIYAESILSALDHGETSPVDRDAVADLDVAQLRVPASTSGAARLCFSLLG